MSEPAETLYHLGRRIVKLYGIERGITIVNRLIKRLHDYTLESRSFDLSEQDVILICYGDHLLPADSTETPLQTLHQFLKNFLYGVINTIHILPFYPYSSDDGFSVIDYRAVNSQLGSWSDIQQISKDYRMMFDLVLNHVSTSSEWFQCFLKDEVPYRDYFITVDPSTDMSNVIRPRTHPLLTPFRSSTGIKHVWTTFSDDQVDLNFAEPAVLLEMIEVLLFYVRMGANFIRLDAIAYLWKEIGTTCIHLPQTHRIVRLLRNVLDIVAPWVRLITETNVPHEENLSYFGNGHDEAQMVYQFTLPPLLLYSFYTGSAGTLSRWAESLPPTTPSATFFNFTASHDGIGVRPLTGLISDNELAKLLKTVEQRGGHISYKSNRDGSRSAYEMNITFFDALAVPGEPLETSIDRFIVSQAIMLALAGVPGIYLPSLIGAANWHDGFEQTGRARSINREKFDYETLTETLGDPSSRAAQVLKRYTELLRIRRKEPAFHPAALQRILPLHDGLLAVERSSLDGQSTVLALHNVTDKPIQLMRQQVWYDLLTGITLDGTITLNPYEILWLQPVL